MKIDKGFPSGENKKAASLMDKKRKLKSTEKEADEYASKKKKITDREVNILKKQDIHTTEQYQHYLSILNQTALDLSKMTMDEDLELYVLKQLKKLTGAEIALFSSFDDENKVTVVRHILTEEKILKTLVGILGKRIYSMSSARVTEELYKEMTGNLIGTRYTLHEASFGSVSKKTSAIIQKLFHIDRFTGLAYMLDNKLYATSLLALKKETADIPQQILLNFINLASIAIQRKQAELKKKASEEKNRAILLNTPDHIIMHDKDLKYTFVVNPQLGLTEKDMLGKTDYDLLSKEDADKLTTIKTRVIETGEPFHLETSLISASGKEEFFDGNFIPTIDVHGEVSGLLGYFINVTERKQIQNELKKREATLQKIFNILPIGLWFADKTGKLIS